jgi:hypothetical protein
MIANLCIAEIFISSQTLDLVPKIIFGEDET